MILTLKELAAYLRVEEGAILRMVESGRIKGARIGGQWRFNGSQIDTLFFPDTATAGDAAALTALVRTHLDIPVSRVMDEKRMILDLQADDVDGVIREMTQPALLKALVLDLQDLQGRILARERLLSTGVGNGVAVPHPRDPVPALNAPALVVFARSVGGVDFGASDGRPVHLFFMLCCQNIELHLHVMGRLAQLLRDETFVQACRECTTASDVMRLVMARERQHFLGRS